MSLAAAVQEYLSGTDEQKEAFHTQGLRRLNEDVVLMPSGRRLTCGTQVNLGGVESVVDLYIC